MKQRVGVIFLISMAIWAFLSTSSYCQVGESLQVVIVGPINSANYRWDKLNQLILRKWHQHFKPPVYEIAAIVPQDQLPQQKGRPVVPDRDTMAAMAKHYQADIVVALDISRLRSDVLAEGLKENGNTWQETDLILECRTYEARSNRFDRFQVKRYQNEVMGVNTGAAILMNDAMDEVLRRVLSGERDVY